MSYHTVLLPRTVISYQTYGNIYQAYDYNKTNAKRGDNVMSNKGKKLVIT